MCARYQRLKHQHQQFITIMSPSSTHQYHQKDLEDLSTNVVKIDEDDPHSKLINPQSVY